ncbi:Hypothetical protein SM2011_b21399 (plasmid) [Sinorhizobium meliloti 2011]|nr:Hypothetical protein SM2011_b21399 [Sinorhizobium meliloti 2011]
MAGTLNRLGDLVPRNAAPRITHLVRLCSRLPAAFIYQVWPSLWRYFLLYRPSCHFHPCRPLNYSPPPPFPPEAPLPDAAMASEVRLVDSNMVTAGGVTAAKRPQAFKNSRLTSSAGEPSFRSSSNCSPSVWLR